MVYVESGDGSQWLGRFWSADGRVNLPSELWEEDAFALELDGHVLMSGWECISAAETPGAKAGAKEVVVELRHTEQPVTVKVHTLLDGTPVLTRWLGITNTSEKSAALGTVAPWSGRLWPKGKFTLGYFTQDIWACEGWFEWRELGLGITPVSSDKGQGFDAPFFVVRNEVNGEYFIGHLAWSANWALEFLRDERGLWLRLGPEARPVQRVIAPGESVITPAAHIGHVSGSLDGAVQAMHDHLRKSVLPPMEPDRLHRIQYLVPADQGYYLPFDESSALACVDVAAAMGAELFILDAYWWDITCDWVPSETRFPNGLAPLRQKVREMGMLFGLYVETEGGRGPIPESKVYQEHPDWFGPRNILKLTIPEAAAWMESEICRIIEEYDLDLYRLDYNPLFTFDGPTTTRNGIVENNYWRYYEVLYDIYERIAKKYPKLILQQCAAGGARNDLGMCQRFHEPYLTDGLSLPRELQIYAGQTMGLPPERIVTAHGADVGSGIGKPQNLDTVLRMSYSTSTPLVFAGMVAPSVEELSPQRRERFLHYGRVYKDFIRPLLPTCRMYHHEPVNARGGVESSPWFATEYAAPDRSAGWATIIRMVNGAGQSFRHVYHNEVVSDSDVAQPAEFRQHTYIFVPRGLDPARTYHVTYDSIGTTATVDGLRLLQEGIPVRLENAGMSELLLFQEA